ncbi:19527_t:CDS:2 [Gigaspora rosea]|nr:19527_t:CDS:2 [Gigaspora rosea]
MVKQAKVVVEASMIILQLPDFNGATGCSLTVNGSFLANEDAAYFARLLDRPVTMVHTNDKLPFSSKSPAMGGIRQTEVT